MHALASHISSWLGTYLQTAHAKGFVVGISGGIDSAVTSTLCALTGAPTICLTMPIRQTKAEFDRAGEHMQDLQSRFANVSLQTIDLTPSFETLSAALRAPNAYASPPSAGGWLFLASGKSCKQQPVF
jgi:NAD+ synthase